MSPTEAKVEKHLCERVEETGGEVRKIKFLDRNGAPDRACMWPDHPIVWVEVKRPGGPTHGRQEREHDALRAMGQQVELLQSFEEVDEFIERHCR